MSWWSKLRGIGWGSLLLLSALVRAGTPGECLTITQITIDGRDVFKDGGPSHWYTRAFQALHWETRDSVIRKELLFKLGDCYDAELVAETERNLRQAEIFNDASIKTEIDEEARTVRLLVTTLDRFTLRASFGFSHKGGIDKTQLRLGDTNLLGLNKSLRYTYENRSDGNEVRRTTYQDPRIYGNLALNALYSSTNEGHYREFDLGRPFRRLDDRYAYTFSFKRDQTESDFYRDGAVDLKIPNDVTHLVLDWRRELGTREQSRQYALQVGYREEAYGATPGIQIPEPFEAYPILLGWKQQERRAFVVCQQVDSLVKREDIALYDGFFLASGAEVRVGDRLHPLFEAGWEQIRKPTEQTLSATKLTGRIRLRDGDEKFAELNSFQHFYYFSGAQTYVLGAAYDYRYTTDDLYLPLTLGEDQGLRGFDAFTFTGNKRFLLNLEHRYTYPWRTQRLAFGQVLFLDGGNAWKPGQQDLDLNWSAGLGLRIDAPSILGHKILRMDFAWPLAGGDLSLSVTIGQIFNHNDINRGFDRDY